MGKEQDACEYLEEVFSKLNGYKGVIKLGDEMQKGTRLSKTGRGARTNARIEASQKKQSFNESSVAKDELENVDNDITNELLNRAIEDIFGK